jgi:hypothetical protein
MATAVPQGAAGNNAFKVRFRQKVVCVCGLLNSVQDKEKPMAVRSSNILAARGT